MTLCALFAAAQIGGVFPLLCTPYAEDGSLDCATLAKEAKFVADCGANGIIWPAAKDALGYLSSDEERRGLEAIAAALDGRNVWFTPCCPGTNTTDMLRRVAAAEGIAAKHPGLNMTLLVRMVDDAKCDADYERQYDTLAAHLREYSGRAGSPLPAVIIQTYNGKSPMPSAKLLIDLARRHPEIYGWYKVEGTGDGIVPCARELVAAKPVVKTVFTGWGGRDWLYHYCRVGTRGVISQRPMYADLMVKTWRALEGGSRTPARAPASRAACGWGIPVATDGRAGSPLPAALPTSFSPNSSTCAISRIPFPRRRCAAGTYTSSRSVGCSRTRCHGRRSAATAVGKLPTFRFRMRTRLKSTHV